MDMLQGKVALVTGGSSGIGKAIASGLARDGANVAVVASSDIAKAEAVVREIEGKKGNARAFAANVSDRAVARGLIDEVGRSLGSIDILVTAAGVFLPTPIGEADLDVFERTIDINVKAAFYAIDAVVPAMKANGGGRIICLSSVASRLGVAGFSAYCASKAAISMMVQSLALELAPVGININAIAPGNTATPMNEGMRNDPAQSALLNSLKAATPSTRIFSEPEDIAGIASFLASPAAAAMHGSTILIDEGLSAGISLG